ncbi:MAG: hypothetical protein A2W86_09380 [Bacteroidetes bacterium GWD2_45_23]|nr:MAG: hypothetical protein A2W87_11650 [Bacteroidetes bacterium GWC2_46_850]OFX65401.1 MAG: hypothetical protein A2071_12780 [Bacteroidetes bacterium GWC1_47_7]OFX83524.1 MAG: hypothetical protein A2W86_09380 [Bacteroidetes bacterium GWD2_45_23]HAR38236.1 hypothetical protein [Porphyromonadaceae bacterium]HBB02157.1 hypothetical protein [Porphyromonadaceae bacterium]
MRYYSGIIKLVALIILMPVVLGKCTFSKTFQLYNDYRHIRTLEEQLPNVASSQSMLAPVPISNENLISNGRLVELISPVCEENSITVKQYEPQLLDSEGNYKLYSANMTLSGKYIDLVKTLKYWEDNIQSIRISTLQFEYDEKKMKEEKIEMNTVIKQIEEVFP